MPTPRADTYSAASGAAIYAGRQPFPAWFPSSGSWGNLPGSTTFSASTAKWAGANPGGALVPGIFAYSGATLNTDGCYYDGAFHAGPHMIVWGGGHNDYAGNEVYAVGPLPDAAPPWHRLTDPTIPAPQNASNDASGNPVSRHTYGLIQHLPGRNKMISLAGGARYSDANATLGAVFDYATNTWANRPALVTLPAYDFGNAVSAYNATTDKLWMLTIGNNTKLYAYDVPTDIVTAYNVSWPDYAGNSSAAIHPGLNFLVVFGATGNLKGIDLSAPASPANLTVAGTGPSGGGGFCIQWDAANNRFVAWNGGSTIYFLTAPSNNPLTGTWTWTSVVGAGDVPANPMSSGTFGRFQLWNGGALVLPSPYSPACFYRF